MLAYCYIRLVGANVGVFNVRTIFYVKAVISYVRRILYWLQLLTTIVINKLLNDKYILDQWGIYCGWKGM